LSDLVSGMSGPAIRALSWMREWWPVTASLGIAAAAFATAAAIVTMAPAGRQTAPVVGDPAAVHDVQHTDAAPAVLPESMRRCDALIAHPDDPRRPGEAPGVSWSSLDLAAARDAVEACSRAVAEDTTADPRMRFNLARTYHRLSALRPEERATYVRLAVAHYAAAAESGHAAAQGNLGQMLYDGSSGTRDLARAHEWLRKAALGGFADAYLTLAHAYSSGTGVEPDQRKAVCWYSLVVRHSSVEPYRRWAEQQRALIALDAAEKRKYADGTSGPGECLAIGAVGERPTATRHLGGPA
jgi:hypothetical protein